jgi:hypothetical protein
MFEPGPKPSWLIPALVVSILTIFLAVLFLRTLRLEISRDGISYSNPVRGTQSLTYPEMSAVVLVDYRHEGNGPGGINRSFRMWTIVVTPKVETGKPTLKIPLTVFPRSAYNGNRENTDNKICIPVCIVGNGDGLSARGGIGAYEQSSHKVQPKIERKATLSRLST